MKVIYPISAKAYDLAEKYSLVQPQKEYGDVIEQEMVKKLLPSLIAQYDEGQQIIYQAYA